MTDTQTVPAVIEIHGTMEKIIRHMLANPRQAYAASEISRAVEISSGTTSPIMQTMLAAGWLADEIEPRRPGSVGPLRRLYRFTAGTAPMLRKAIDD
jgi:response regulator of citrate/malate metabolism